MMKNTFLFLFLIFTSCSQVVEKEGILWKITGNGLEQASYLFGTYHGTYGIGADFLDSIPGFYEAFDSVTQYVGEMDMSVVSEARNEYLEKYCGESVMPIDTTYEDLLSETDYELLDLTVRTSLRQFMEDVKEVRPNHLWFMIGQAKRSNILQQMLNVPEKEIMDIYLLKKAKQKGYTVKGLDSYDINFKSNEILYGSTILPQSLQENADTLIANIKRFDKESEGMVSDSKMIKNLKNFENAYRCQDLSGLEKYKKEQLDFVKEAITDSITDFLQNERNLLWMKKIPELISAEPTMIGVGAMHLCGKDGLIYLLRQKGYQLERVK